MLPVTESTCVVLLNVSPVLAPARPPSLNKSCVFAPGTVILPVTLPTKLAAYMLPVALTIPLVYMLLPVTLPAPEILFPDMSPVAIISPENPTASAWMVNTAGSKLLG